LGIKLWDLSGINHTQPIANLPPLPPNPAKEPQTLLMTTILYLFICPVVDTVTFHLYGFAYCSYFIKMGLYNVAFCD
jgi:hypothetical protein